MLIYLKGVHSVQLEHLLDFIYNGEASVGQEELKYFLETGKELQVKGFEAYVAGVGESTEEDPARHINEKADMFENSNNIIAENIISDTLEPSSEQHYSANVASTETNEGKNQISANSDLDLQIMEMVENSNGVWKCKVCGKTAKRSGNIKQHAESHIEGMSHACHICNKSFSTRNS